MSNLATLMVKIGADISELEAGLSKVSRQVEDTGKRMTQMGKTLTTRVTAPLTALAGVAVRSFGIQEKAELQLRAALQANGRQVETLFGQYNEFAQEMQRVTVVGDETTLAMLSQAESLGITGDAAQRAVKNSIAMQSAFGVNAQSALRYTAALEEGNATMLTRYIPALREIDDESERVAKAQEILGNAFSAAESEAEGSTGQMVQMKNAVGDLMEVVGEVVSDAIMPMVNRVKELAESAQTLNPEIVKFGVGVLAAVAAIGPALVILGKLAIAISALLSPIGLVIGATAALAAAILYVWDNWEAVTERISDISWWRNALIDMVQWFLKYNPTALLLDGFNAILDRFGMAIPDPFKGLAGSLDMLRADQKEYEHEFGSFMDAIKNGASSAMSWLANMFDVDTAPISQATEEMERMGRAVEGQMFEPVSMSANKMAVDVGEAGGAMERFRQNLKDTTRQSVEMGQALQSVVTTAISDFATTLGDAFTGDAGASGFFNNILMIVADFGEQLGRSLVAAGIAAQAFQTLLANPVAAIAAGSALIATSRIVKNLLASGPATSVNDALITSSGDVIKFHPDDNILAMKDFSGLGGGGGDFVAETRTSGTDLVTLIRRVEKNESRAGKR